MKIVIKIFICFTLLCCNSSRVIKKDLVIEIINTEIKENSKVESNQNSKLYLNQNDYIISFLNRIDGKYLNNLEQVGIERDALMMLQDRTLKEQLLIQAENFKKVQSNKIKLLNQIQLISVEDEDKKGNNLEDSSVYYINLSTPLISSNKQYAIISFSRGYNQAMEGGIALYKKQKSNWKRISVFDSWIE